MAIFIVNPRRIHRRGDGLFKETGKVEVQREGLAVTNNFPASTVYKVPMKVQAGGPCPGVPAFQKACAGKSWRHNPGPRHW